MNELLKAPIIKIFQIKGITRTQVKCPICGRIHTHGEIDPSRPRRMSHCSSPIKSQEYVITTDPIDVIPTASPQEIFLAEMLTGKLPRGLKSTEFGLQIDPSIRPTGNTKDLYYKLDRARNAFNESIDPVKLDKIHSDLAESIAAEVNE